MGTKPWIMLFASATLISAPAWAGAEESFAPSSGAAITPGAALERYVAASSTGPSWDVESIEIDASIPKLAKQGRLRAIRRLLPHGKPEYQVLSIEGDRTVKQQVIARYLSAENAAAEMPAASVAIAPANYRFRYRASIADAGSLAYVYEITPQKKRAGLLRGQLWVDAFTGLPLRLTGYLVRKPSLFVRRVSLTRETSVCDGVACARITHLVIDTRLVGRTELTITERPLSSAAARQVAAATHGDTIQQSAAETR